MAKVVIKKREGTSNSHNFTLSDYHTTVDGVEIDMITGIELTMNVGEFNSCKLSFAVDDIEVDAEFIAALQGHVEKKEA